MKTTFLHLVLVFLAGTTLLKAQLTIPSDGSDGALNVTSNIPPINLSQAVTGSWDANNSANAGKGIFDPVKRVIVFKYSSVNIDTSRTVTFINHPSRAPVVWLVQGNVTIAGTLSLNGSGAPNNNLLAEPGPGGFRGGANGSLGRGAGMGPGGANPMASYTDSPGLYASVYGNPSVLPLIGGSGGGATFYGGAAGGGGAILIAAANGITITGSVTSTGSGTGSGGAIRLVANSISGHAVAGLFGTIDVRNDGRIRLEANNVTGNLVTLPQTIAVAPASPPTIWPGNDAPTVKITNVDSSAAPAVPTAPLDLAADVGVSTNGASTVTIQTTNFPTNGVVQVRAAPKFGTAAWTTAVFQSGDATFANWTATVTFPTGFTTLQARATVP